MPLSGSDAQFGHQLGQRNASNFGQLAQILEPFSFQSLHFVTKLQKFLMFFWRQRSTLPLGDKLSIAFLFFRRRPSIDFGQQVRFRALFHHS